MVGYMKRMHSENLNIEVTACPLISWANEQSINFMRLDCIDVLNSSDKLSVAILSIVDVCHDHIVPFGRGSAELDSCFLLFKLLDTSLWSQKAIFRSSATRMFDFHRWNSLKQATPYTTSWQDILYQKFHAALEGAEHDTIQQRKRLELTIETTEEGIRLLTTPVAPSDHLTGKTLVGLETTPGSECLEEGERLRRLFLQYARVIRNDKMKGFVVTATREVRSKDARLRQTCFGDEPCVEDPLSHLKERHLVLETAHGKLQIQEAFSSRGVPVLMDVATEEWARRLLEQT